MYHVLFHSEVVMLYAHSQFVCLSFTDVNYKGRQQRACPQQLPLNFLILTNSFFQYYTDVLYSDRTADYICVIS